MNWNSASAKWDEETFVELGFKAQVLVFHPVLRVVPGQNTRKHRHRLLCDKLYTLTYTDNNYAGHFSRPVTRPLNYIENF